MKNPSRALLLGLCAAVLLSSAPLPAAAAIARVAAAVPASPMGAGAAGAARLGASLGSPIGLSLRTPSLAPSALTPAPSLNPAPAPANAGLRAPVLAASALPLSPSMNGAAAAAPEGPAAAPAAALAAEDAAKIPAVAGVEEAFRLIRGEKGAAAPASVVLDRLFEGTAKRSSAADAPAAGAPSAPGTGLAPASAKLSAPTVGPRWVFHEAKPAPGAQSSWSRTFSVGLLAAVIPLALTTIIVFGAQMLGYELHPNYTNPASGLEGTTPSVLQAALLFTGAAVMAPVAEEILFRAGIQGSLSKISNSLRLGVFWVPAVIGSLIFVAVHETADPVLFSTRFIHAMILAYAFKKEGILASMAAHGLFNGLLTLPLLGAAAVGLLGPAPAAAAALSVGGAAAAFYALYRGMRYILLAKSKVLKSLGLFGAALAGLVILSAAASAFLAPPAAGAMSGLTLAALGGLSLALSKAVSVLHSQRGQIDSGALTPKPFTSHHGMTALVLLGLGYSLMANPFWLLAIVGLVPWLLFSKKGSDTRL